MDGYKFYCSRRGRNHEIVRGELASTVKVSLFLAAVVAIFAVVMRLRNPSEAGACAAILLVFSALPLSYAFSALQQTRKLRSLSLQPTDRQTRPLRFPR